MIISTSNTAPIANPGAHQTVALGSTANLSGAASRDADNDRLSYRWSILSQPAGGAATLANPATTSPTFVPKATGLYVVQLIVNDGKADSPPATTTVTVVKSASVSGGTSQTTGARSSFAALNTPSGGATITSLSPTSGPVGTAVTISGTGFGTQGTNSVKFYGIVAPIISWNATTIVATVPSTTPISSVSAKVWIGGVGSNESPFTVLPMPSITKLSVNSGPANSTVTITGSNFATPGVVTFNGTPASPTIWNATSIVTTVPAGATTGNVVVSLSGVGSNGAAFMVVPAPQPPGVNFIQGNYSTPATTQTAPVTYVAAQVAGDLNVVVVGWRDTAATVKSVTDTAGNAYSLVVGPTTQISNGTQSIYYAKNIKAATAGGNTVTVAFSAAATDSRYPDC